MSAFPPLRQKETRNPHSQITTLTTVHGQHKQSASPGRVYTILAAYWPCPYAKIPESPRSYQQDLGAMKSVAAH